MTLRRLRRLRPKEEDAAPAPAPERPGPADVYRALAAAGGTLPRVRKVGPPRDGEGSFAGAPPPLPGFALGRTGSRDRYRAGGERGGPVRWGAPGVVGCVPRPARRRRPGGSCAGVAPVLKSVSSPIPSCTRVLPQRLPNVPVLPRCPPNPSVASCPNSCSQPQHLPCVPIPPQCPPPPSPTPCPSSSPSPPPLALGYGDGSPLPVRVPVPPGQTRPHGPRALGKPLSGSAGPVTALVLPRAPRRFLSVGGKRERSRHPEQKWLSLPCTVTCRGPGSRLLTEATAGDVPNGARASCVTSLCCG